MHTPAANIRLAHRPTSLLYWLYCSLSRIARWQARENAVVQPTRLATGISAGGEALVPSIGTWQDNKTRFVAQCMPSAEQLGLSSKPWRPYLAGPVNTTRWQRTRNGSAYREGEHAVHHNRGSSTATVYSSCPRMLASRRD
jgi:hypothetical protein